MSVLLRAVAARSDDRGFCRTTIDELVADTGMSRSTVKRTILALVAEGKLQFKSKSGKSGGILLRITSHRQNGSPKQVKQVTKTGQNGSTGYVFTQGGGPYGALPPLLRVVDFQNGSRGALPPVTDDRARKWRDAINDALHKGFRHTPECFKRRRPTNGCSYCDHIFHLVGDPE